MYEIKSHYPSGYLDRQKALLEVISELQRLDNLDGILQSIIFEVQQLLKVNQVAVDQFNFNVEQLGGNKKEFIKKKWRTHHLFSKQRSNLENKLGEMYAHYAKNESRESLQDPNKFNFNHSSCYLGQTINDQKLAIFPLFQNQQLWGLFIIEQNSHPRLWQEEEILWIEQIILCLEIAIQQSQMYEQQQQHSKSLNKAVDGAIEREQTIAKIIDRIRQSLEINTIFATATEESRKLLNADRVAIYRFEQDWSGHFVSDATADGWTSILTKQCESPLLDPNFSQCKVRSLCNPQLSDTYLKSIEGKIFNPENLVRVCNNVYEAGFSPCYLEILECYQAQAYIIVAIYHQESLWGLLAAYQNSGPRQWEDPEINFLVQVSSNLGIAIDQAQLLSETKQYQEQLETSLAIALRQQKETLAKIAEKERALSAVIDKIRLTLDLKTIFQTAATEVQKLLEVERIAIYQFKNNDTGQFIFESDPQNFPSLVGESWVDQFWQQDQKEQLQQNQAYVVNNLNQDQTFSFKSPQNLGLISLAVVPLFQGQELWGLLTAFQYTSPRTWPDNDVQLLKQVAHHLSIALQQTHYIHQIQDYAREQTIAVEQEKALSQVIDKIRRTLDLETIFKTTATEVRQLLQADRVAVFQFDPNSQWTRGEFVSEDVVSEFNSVLQAKVEDHCFGENHARYYQQGKILGHDDIYQAGLLDCHVAILSRFQVRANLVSPLVKGKELWGLLCIHQCSGPRHWKTSEKGFVAKIATNLGVALQQAQLLQETQQKTQDLQKALEDVKQQKRYLAQISAQDRALARVIERIRRTLDIETIFRTTTQEIRQLLKCDRVVVYRFNHDWGGEFLYESLGEGWKPLTGELAEKYLWNDTYLQENRGGRYRHNQTFAVNDIHQACLTPCHIELLEQFQVQGFIVVPVFVSDRLWGLLGVYQNSAPRSWEKREINLLKQVSNQLGVAVYQSQLLSQTQQQSEDLEKTVADLNAIVDNLGDGLLVINVYGEITRSNLALEQMFNLNQSPQGKYLLDLFPPELADLIKKTAQNQQQVVTAEIKLAQTRVGQALVSNIIQGISGKEGEKCLGKVILIRDITAKREIEKMKNDFLATVSHELRTPLTSVLGFASLIEDKLNRVIFRAITVHNDRTQKALAQVRTNLKIIVSESERLTNLINEVLDIAKIESGKVEWNFESVSLLDILEQAISATFPLFESKQLVLQRDLPEDLPPIWGDKNRLIQVVINLLSNAVKFTEIGSVTCQVKEDYDCLVIAITDTGIGIPDNEQQKVFEHFQQVGNILTNKPQGNGLGLSICRQIIENHGGKIWVKSQVGQGSTFFFTLPLSQRLPNS
ncbi:MAG TPA: histidine kinase [Cyanothece sp. UBA12306]|nr:histidine kinase [Cyanothece sp. UBA12306]